MYNLFILVHANSLFEVDGLKTGSEIFSVYKWASCILRFKI